MKRPRFIEFVLPSIAARLALSGALIAACASAASAQSYGTAPYPPPYPSTGGASADDPIQEGRDGMRILGTITVPPGAAPDVSAPSAPMSSMDEEATGSLSADHMAWSLAAKNAYAAHQYTEARSLFRRAAQGGDAQAEMMLGQMAERGQGGPQDLEEALGWYAAAANKGVSGASKKVAAITDTLRRQAAQSIASAQSSEERAKPQPAKPAAPAPANKQTANSAQPRASQPSARGQKAESLTPRPAPQVTAEAEPLADPAATQSEADRQAAAKERQRAQQEAQQQQERARKQKQKEEQARQQAQKQKEEQAQQQAQKQKDDQAQQQARAEEGPQASVPEWPVAAAQPTRATQGARSDRANVSSRGNSGEEQEASLPESLQPPSFSDSLAPLAKRHAPPLNPETKAKLDQARAFESGKDQTKNEAKAIELYKSIADQSAEAAFDLGWRYASGRGVKRDDKEAARYYRMAAEKGYPPAENNLGGLLADGRGVKRDEEEAVDWFRRAALQDFAPAQVNLALMYGKGRGLEQSDANAMAWYSRAAKSGYGPATASLAMMYSEGKGVPQDQKTADFLMESAKGASPASALVSVEP